MTAAARFRAGLLLGLIALHPACAAAQRAPLAPEVRLIALALLEADAEAAGTQRFRVTLRIANSNAVAVAIAELRFRVRLAGEGLLTGRSSSRLVLPPQGQTTLSVDVDGDTVASASRLAALARGPENTLRYEIDGVLVPARRFRNAYRFDFRGRVPLSAAP